MDSKFIIFAGTICINSTLIGVLSRILSLWSLYTGSFSLFLIKWSDEMATSSLNNPSASTPSNDMLSIVPCALCRVLPDSQLRILFANALFHTLFACPSGQKLPALCTMMHTPDAAKLKKKLVKFHIAKEPVFSMQFDAVCCDGTVKPLLLQCTKDNSSFILSFTDLSKQKDAEEKLRLCRKLCQTSSHQSGIMLSYYDIHTHLLTFPFGEIPELAEILPVFFIPYQTTFLPLLR